MVFVMLVVICDSYVEVIVEYCFVYINVEGFEFVCGWFVWIVE